MSEHPIKALIGPTASGKSAHALEMASECEGVIVNFDSMQVYDVLPLLTAQPSVEEQAEIPHRLYGYIDPKNSCNAAKWAKDAVKTIQEIHESGQTPVLVGGTGLYLYSLIDGLSPIPDIDPEIRKNLLPLSTDDVTKLVQEKDPDFLKTIEPNDTQRMVRALEVFEGTDKSILWWQSQPRDKYIDAQFQVYTLNPDRNWLADRINARVLKMLDMGALDEIKDLALKIESGDIPEDAGIVMAHGFRVFRDYLLGLKTLEEAIERTQIETRQYAKRQRTFLRQQVKDKENVSVTSLSV